MAGRYGRLVKDSREMTGRWAGRLAQDRWAGGSQPAMRFTCRTEATDWARTVMGDARTLFLDTETTGLDGTAEIIEIAVVDADGRVLLDTLVRPLRPIPAVATRIHGIQDYLVASAPAWPEVVPRLETILADRRVVVYNAAFDRRMVSQCCAAYGLSSVAQDWTCAMLAFAAFAGDRNERRSGYRWHKLESAVTRFGGRPGGHRALGDALACKTVVAGMATWEEEGV